MQPKNFKGIKICGITQCEQALEIASLDINAIGIIGVRSSKRFVEPELRMNIFSELSTRRPELLRVWVTANLNNQEMTEGIKCKGSPSVIQLHGDESVQRCLELKRLFPNVLLWKAISIKDEEDIINAKQYEKYVDAILLDSWSDVSRGGTGKRIPLKMLNNANFKTHWWLAGGISPEGISEILSQVNPYGLDASSRLEISPGIKDISKVKLLIEMIRINE